MLELNKLYNMDCMDGMKQFPDKYFELAIVDPVYGDVSLGGYMFGKGGENKAKRINYNLSLWEQPKTDKTYFEQLFRVSKNQVIWGGNYFITSICKDSQCWIVWDKKHPDGVHFADCELAWTSFNKATRIFRYMWNGMLQEKMGDSKELKIHPTQKPIDLYKWILQNYANEGDKILDTHVGSASSLIACKEMGFDYIGFELDEDYYNKANERMDKRFAQMRLDLSNWRLP